MERHVYTRHSFLGVALMLVLDLLTLFGAWGASMWALQMAWIPIHAAGIINGLGHWWGYRNFESPDTSTNLTPWGCGSAARNCTTTTTPSRPRPSSRSRRFEVDIGWGYIRLLQAFGLARPRKLPPKVVEGEIQPADRRTLEALIANRYEVMAHFGRELRAACRAELQQLKAKGARHSEQWQQFKLAKRWLPRDSRRIPQALDLQLAAARAASPVLEQMVTMREELRALWTRTNVSAEQLVAELQAWCQRAEASGIAELRAVSVRLRASRLAASAL
jgi:stearoyl-CoA desaturase (delta-9 desaturase)